MESWCEGCHFHSFPYSASIPVSNIKDKVRVFNDKEDVLDVIGLLIKETEELNMKKGMSFDIVNSVFKQLPFFCCYNSIYDSEFQKDVGKYLYCKEFRTSAFKGSYGEQPNKWIRKAFVLRNAFAKKENNMIKKEQGNNNG